jgi:predicted amidohydrolase
MMLDIALLQIEIHDSEDAERRLQRGLYMLRKLEQPVQLAIFPELWMVGFFSFCHYAAGATEVPGPITAELAAAARELNIWLHAGSFVERGADGALYNTSLLFDPRGKLRASYRKIHLFGYDSEESSLLRPGNAVTVLQTPFGCVGLSTCYDLRFPELYRQMLKQGAELFLVTSAWPHPRLEHWLVLNRARAIENLSYVVACNAAGETRGRRLLGNSLVIDPWGDEIARGGEHEQVVFARVNPAQVRDVRNRFPALRDRRLRLSR